MHMAAVHLCNLDLAGYIRKNESGVINGINGGPMNRIAVAIALAVGVFAAGSASASDKSDILAILKQWNNPDDMMKSAASCAKDAAILDVIPPYEWHGPGACANFAKDYDAFVQKEGMAYEIGTMGKPKEFDVAGDRAYVSVPFTFRGTQKGKPVKDTGMMAFALQKTAAGWRITALSWATLTSNALP
jgi:hypothetical protein